MTANAPARGPLIAIDGPAGSGKSTLARRMAEALGLAYINTGLMYRAVTLEAVRANVALSDGPRLARLAGRIRFDLDPTSSPPSLQIDGAVPSPRLTSPEVERRVSEVSGHPEVRAVMRVEQRRLGAGGGVVEGRDIGSVVFPIARVKIFLMASASERAARRAEERTVDPARTAIEPEIAEELAVRDASDSRVNPFVPAEDAVVLDTTGRDADETFVEALALVRARLGDQR